MTVYLVTVDTQDCGCGYCRPTTPIAYYTDRQDAVEHATQVCGTVVAVSAGTVPYPRGTRGWLLGWNCAPTWGEVDLSKAYVNPCPVGKGEPSLDQALSYRRGAFVAHAYVTAASENDALEALRRKAQEGR